MRSLRTGLAGAVLMLAACATMGPQQVQLPSPYSEHGVAVTVDGLWKDGYGTVTGLSGLATNNSGQDLALCQVTFDVLDSGGIKVAKAVDSTTSLKAGQSWRFQAGFTSANRVDFAAIAAGPITVIAE